MRDPEGFEPLRLVSLALFFGVAWRQYVRSSDYRGFHVFLCNGRARNQPLDDVPAHKSAQ